MVGLRGIARRGADAAILFPDQLRICERLVRRVAPEFAAHALVQTFGESFGQSIGKRFDHDRGIIVIGALETFGQLVLAYAGRDQECADVIGKPARARRHKVRDRNVGAPLAACELLTQRMQHRERASAGLVAVDENIIAIGIGWPESEKRAGG